MLSTWVFLVDFFHMFCLFFMCMYIWKGPSSELATSVPWIWQCLLLAAVGILNNHEVPSKADSEPLGGGMSTTWSHALLILNPVWLWFWEKDKGAVYVCVCLCVYWIFFFGNFFSFFFFFSLGKMTLEGLTPFNPPSVTIKQTPCSRTTRGLRGYR